MIAEAAHALPGAVRDGGSIIGFRGDILRPKPFDFAVFYALLADICRHEADHVKHGFRRLQAVQ
jgi:hypothetical protein